MKQGAFGVSTGLIYPPNAYANLDELVALSDVAGAMGGLHASHLRYDGTRLRDGIEEILAIGERAKMPVHIFHVKVTGAKNFGRMKEVIALIEAARARGVRVSADQYPYVASSTNLTATIPDWAEEGGSGEAGRTAEGQAAARADPPRDGRPESDVGEPLSVGGHLAEHPARVDRPDPRRRRRQRGSEPAVRGHADRRGGEEGRQGSVRFRLRSAGRGSAAASAASTSSCRKTI